MEKAKNDNSNVTFWLIFKHCVDGVFVNVATGTSGILSILLCHGTFREAKCYQECLVYVLIDNIFVSITEGSTIDHHYLF